MAAGTGRCPEQAVQFRRSRSATGGAGAPDIGWGTERICRQAFLGVNADDLATPRPATPDPRPILIKLRDDHTIDYCARAHPAELDNCRTRRRRLTPAYRRRHLGRQGKTCRGGCPPGNLQQPPRPLSVESRSCRPFTWKGISACRAGRPKGRRPAIPKDADMRRP